MKAISNSAESAAKMRQDSIPHEVLRSGERCKAP